MKPAHYLKEKNLVVQLPEVYTFQRCWNYFCDEQPETKEFQDAEFCVIDGSRLERVDSLGMGSEMFIMGQSGKDFVFSGFQREQMLILKQLIVEKEKPSRFFDSLESAVNSFKKEL